MKIWYLSDFSTKHERLYAQADHLYDLLQPDDTIEDEEVGIDLEEPEEEPEDEPEEEPAKEVQKCPHCTFESDLPNIFKRHTNSIRICSECHEIFCGERSAQKFKSHQKKHVVKPVKPEKVFPCEICNKSFKFASKLKEHYKWSPCGRQVDY